MRNDLIVSRFLEELQPSNFINDYSVILYSVFNYFLVCKLVSRVQSDIFKSLFYFKSRFRLLLYKIFTPEALEQVFFLLKNSCR